MRKVSPGDPLNIPARTFNTFVDAASHYSERSQNTGRDESAHGFPGVVVPVKNTTGGDLSRFAVVRLDGPPFTYAENAAGFVNHIAFKGKKPAAGESGLIAIYQDPAPAGEYARAMIHGVTAVTVTFSDADTVQFADLVEDETDKLSACAMSGAEILHHEALGTTFPVDRVAYVRLSSTSGREIGVFQLQSGSLEQGDKVGVSAAPMEWDDATDDWIIEGTAGGGTAADNVTVYGNVFQGIAWGTSLDGGGTKTGDRVVCLRATLADKWFAVSGGHTMSYGTLTTDDPTSGSGSGEAGESKYRVLVSVDGGGVKVQANNSLALSLSDSDTVYLHWDSGAGLRVDTLLDGRADGDFVSKGHWDIIAVDSEDGKTTAYGCGLGTSESTDATTGEVTTTVVVDASDLAGDGLLSNTSGGGCLLDINTGCGIGIVADAVVFDAVTVAGCGLAASGTCTLDVNPVALAGDGLGTNTAGGACELKVNAGCGILITGDAVEFDVATVAGDGLSVSGSCTMNVTAGCGLQINAAGGVEVNPGAIAGGGLTTGTDCELAVDTGCGLQVAASGVLEIVPAQFAGCGLQASGTDCELEVNAADLAGDGLSVSGTCSLNVTAGCGLRINAAGGVEVSASDLAGNGLSVGSDCSLDLDCTWIENNCSVSGSQGPQGPQGATGGSGSTGPQGPQGNQGSTGATGPCPTVTGSCSVATGSTCSVTVTSSGSCAYDFDFTIPKGDQGDTGSTGPQGPQGPQGDQGSTGAQGPQGDSGSQGPQGVPGATGPQGPQGDQGGQGAPGSQGPQGTQGATGSQGAQGAAGTQGPQGGQGSQGVPGATGPQGTQGPQGAGTQGPQGAPGTGSQGAQGPQGDPGTGSQGAQGPQGSQGDPGDKMAIVPAAGDHVALFCVESPEVRFEDTLKVPLGGRLTVVKVDRVFLDVCEPESIDAVSIITPRPADAGAFVAGGVLTIEVSGDVPAFAIVRLSGIRKGRLGVRFPLRTAADMERNNAFWGQAQR